MADHLVCRICLIKSKSLKSIFGRQKKFILIELIAEFTQVVVSLVTPDLLIYIMYIKLNLSSRYLKMMAILRKYVKNAWTNSVQFMK